MRIGFQSTAFAMDLEANRILSFVASSLRDFRFPVAGSAEDDRIQDALPEYDARIARAGA